MIRSANAALESAFLATVEKVLGIRIVVVLRQGRVVRLR